MALILRQETAAGFVTKGTPLTNSEVDNNNVELYNLILGQVSAAGDTMTGKLNFAAATTAAASFLLPVGVNVTSPINGDLWATSSGIFYRFAGATKQIAFTDTPVGTAANSDLLDGLDSTYFTNATNLVTGTVPVARLTGSYDISVTGNAATATRWASARSITLGGDLTGSVSIDGTANVTLTATIAANSVALGTDTTGNYAGAVTAGSGISVTGSAGEGTTFSVAHGATSAQGSVANTGFGAIQSITLDSFGHITAISSVDFTSAHNTVNITAINTAGTYYPMFSGGATGRQPVNVDTSLSYNPANDTLSLTNLSCSTMSSTGAASVGTTLSVGSSLSANSGSFSLTVSATTVSGTNGTFTGTVTAADFNSTSDENLKENIYTIRNALDTVGLMRGVEFDWKEDHRPSAGVIAQEIQQVIPHAVSDNGQNLVVNYNQIIGYLIEAIKELKHEVDIIKNK